MAGFFCDLFYLKTKLSLALLFYLLLVYEVETPCSVQPNMCFRNRTFTMIFIELDLGCGLRILTKLSSEFLQYALFSLKFQVAHH